MILCRNKENSHVKTKENNMLVNVRAFFEDSQSVTLRASTILHIERCTDPVSVIDVVKKALEEQFDVDYKG